MSNEMIHAIAGSVGGIVSMTITYPLVTLSTRLQVNSENKSNLYSGLSSALFGIALTNGVYYYFYEGAKKITKNNFLASSAIAGIVTVFVTNPIWLVNTRVSVDHSTSWETVRKVIRQEGTFGLWKGTSAALVLVINPIIQYTLYEKMLAIVSKRVKPSPLYFFYLGALSKLVATIITYPYIVAKSRLQTGKYSNLLKCLLDIVQKDGVFALYAGIHYKVIQSVFTAAFLFMSKYKLN